MYNFYLFQLIIYILTFLIIIIINIIVFCFQTMFHRTALLIAALLWTQTSLTSAGNILVYPVEGSRWVNMNIILKELNKRGHELTVVRSSMSLQIPENAPHYKSLTVQVTEAMDLDKPDQTALLLKNTIESKRSKWSILALIAAYQMLFNFMEQGNRVQKC